MTRGFQTARSRSERPPRNLYRESKAFSMKIRCKASACGHAYLMPRTRRVFGEISQTRANKTCVSNHHPRHSPTSATSRPKTGYICNSLKLPQPAKLQLILLHVQPSQLRFTEGSGHSACLRQASSTNPDVLRVDLVTRYPVWRGCR